MVFTADSVGAPAGLNQVVIRQEHL